MWFLKGSVILKWPIVCTKSVHKKRKTPNLVKDWGFVVGPLGFEPRLFWTKTRRVASYTMGQFYFLEPPSVVLGGEFGGKYTINFINSKLYSRIICFFVSLCKLNYVLKTGGARLNYWNTKTYERKGLRKDYSHIFYFERPFQRSIQNRYRL